MFSRLNRFLVILTALQLLAGAAYAQAPDTLWTKTFGGPFEDYGERAQQTFDGGFIMCGETYSYGGGGGYCDAWLLKTDVNGDCTWSRIYGGIQYDFGECVIQTADSGFVVIGRTDSYSGSLGEYDTRMIKTDKDGFPIWTRLFGGSGVDVCYDVRQTSDGGYVLVGRTTSFGIGDSSDVWLLKTDSQGYQIWEAMYEGMGVDEGNVVRQTQDGGYIIAGNTTTIGVGDQDIWIIKTNSGGGVEWDTTYGGTLEEKGYGIVETPDLGGYVVMGRTISFGAGARDCWLFKINDSHAIEWERFFGGPLDDDGSHLERTYDNGFIIAGSACSFGAPDGDLWLIKTDSMGDTIWTYQDGGSGWDMAGYAQQTTDGGYFIAGRLWSPATLNDFWLIRLESDTSLPFIQVQNSINFSATAANTYLDSLLIIHNTGTAPLIVDSMYIVSPGTYTVIGATSFQILPNGSHSVIVRFEPDTIGYFVDTLNIVNNDHLERVVLTGIGYPNSVTTLDPDHFPFTYKLDPPSPNPFNASTVIPFSLPTRSHVELSVYDLAGRRVAVLADEWMNPGSYQATFDAGGLPSGVYLCRLQAGEFSAVTKMLLLK